MANENIAYSSRKIKKKRGPFVCFVCDKVLEKRYNLKRHMQLHTGDKGFICSICSMAFIQKSDLQRHSLTHSDEKNFVCEVNNCGKRFRNNRGLRSHKTNRHMPTSVVPIWCDFCSKTFKCKRTLERHQRGMHNGFIHACDVCGKEFYRKQHVRIHVKKHIAGRRVRSLTREDEEGLFIETGEVFDFDPEGIEMPLVEYQEPIIHIEPLIHKKDLDREFLYSFLPRLRKMGWLEKNEFKKSVLLAVEKVLES